ncbi:Arginine N-methyltransferase, mitochondrial [Fulvia fulva]|nr:Arginine N-methyltransferase, mitochondrial [Fulvia fulva]WPV31834.1 Arginine N-methyltransferase, mitochondrial [Fulvia fulva]
MRSSLSRTARQLSRNANRSIVPSCRVSGVRWSSTDDGHKWSTPLAKQLAEAITTTGPLPVASYMRQVLTSDLGGYYTGALGSDRDPFGAKGDFVTSPEISQIFGELVGLWVVAEWIAQGRKSEGVYLMEVGPGRGTLMDDMLRTIRNFPPLAKAIEAVYLVEASEPLRQAQHKLLCGDNPFEKSELGWQSISRHSPDLKIIWTEDVRFVPREANKTPFIIAHEFFDALPIHIFQVTKTTSADQDRPIQTPTGPIKAQRNQAPGSQWRELLVSPRPPHRLKEGEPEFELSLSRTQTPHSMYLPETSPRYTALKETDGATIEISPESQAYVRDFAIRLGGSNPEDLAAASKPTAVIPGREVPAGPQEVPLQKSDPSGAAIIIDYGPPATIPVNSLRGIRAHKRVSPFGAAGATDVSADVDFMALAETAINSSPGVEVHGPVDQARFLTAMGIEERAAQLVKKAVDKERSGSTGKDKGELTDLVKRIESGWKRLVDISPQGMGRLYQVLAIVPHKPPVEGQPRRRPVGFGGDVTL